MTIDLIHLRKLLKFCILNDEDARRALRREAYEDRRRETHPGEGGGDFHAPFWSDAKAYVTNGSNLLIAIDDRIERNARRSRLYPIMGDRFIEWWQNEQRTTNSTLIPIEENVHAHHRFDEIGITVKVDNLLALQSDTSNHKLIYPYFSESPQIPAPWARVGLWMMAETLRDWDVDDMIILDIHRGRSFSTLSDPLRGNERAALIDRIGAIRILWDEAVASLPPSL